MYVGVLIVKRDSGEGQSVLELIINTRRFSNIAALKVIYDSPLCNQIDAHSSTNEIMMESRKCIIEYVHQA